MVAAFDTRVEKVRRWPGSAAHKAARMLRKDGFDTTTTESFFVVGVAGPLVSGEVERAHAWGRRLAGELATTVAADQSNGA